MWKSVARGIRETLERRTCRTNVYSQSSQDSNAKSEVKTSLSCQQKFLYPSFFSSKSGSCGSTKTGSTKDKDDNSRWNTKHTWSEAVGWSSILAVGWVVCQTLCLRRRLFEKEHSKRQGITISHFSEASISYLFGQVLNIRPKQALPVTNCVGITNLNYNEDAVEWSPNKPFGPITVEEALDEASDEFGNTHKLVMGEFQLRYGIRAVEDKRYNDALKHFTAGAKLSSPASMFNLGLCYEMGLGTLVDHAKAAKYYKDAAEQGHADAIYNLGVFYAQGRGGYEINIDRARSFFARAAKLGQVQAQQALNLEKYYEEQSNGNVTSVFPDICENSVNYVQNRKGGNILTKLANYNAAPATHLHVAAVSGGPSYRTTLEEPKNPTEIFLEFLGLNEPNLVPVAVVSNDCTVPC